MTKKKVYRNVKGQFMKGRKGGPGRPKKIKGTGKPMEQFIAVYNDIGGAEELKRWALQNNSNQAAFYSMLFRTVPRDVAADLLLPKHTEEKQPVRIEYVSMHLQERVEQLEAFILVSGLEVPEVPVRVGAKDSGGGDGGNEHGNGE